MRCGDLIENERPVRHVIDGKGETLLERRLDRRRRVRVVLGYEDALHTTKRRARTRRKIRSFVQSLQRQVFMAGLLCTARASFSLLLRGRLRRRARRAATGATCGTCAALPTAAGVVRRRGAFLLVVVHLLNLGLGVGRELVFDLVEDRLVLRARGLGESLRSVALVLAVGVAE